MKDILFSFVYRGDKIPDGIAHAIEILKIINFLTVNLFVGNIFRHEVQGVFDTLQIQSEIFNRFME